MNFYERLFFWRCLAGPPSGPAERNRNGVHAIDAPAAGRLFSRTMRAIVRPGRFSGTFRIPASKSHTIRRLLVASLASGESVLDQPLDSLDAASCAAACRAFGAEVFEERDAAGRLRLYRVNGIGLGAAGGALAPPEAVVDVGNSGTTLYLALALAGLGAGGAVFTGDHQIRRRSAAPLLAALNGLGVEAWSTRGDGCAPIVVRGPWRGGRVSIECPTSQYLSALLLAAPLAPAGVATEIDVPLLNERPYVEMTLSYLDAQGVPYEASPDRSYFRIPGGAAYRPMSGPVPGDWSSAAFPAGAAAVSGGPVTLTGLDPADTQGDKAVLGMLGKMGCTAAWKDGAVEIRRAGGLVGVELDLNATPDALPLLSAVACYAYGETGLGNVPNARIKETDRIAVMAAELRKLGAGVEEVADGLIVRGAPGGRLSGGRVKSHDDHRVAMALAVAALGAAGPVEIEAAECAAVTYPGFWEMIGAETSA